AHSVLRSWLDTFYPHMPRLTAIYLTPAVVVASQEFLCIPGDIAKNSYSFSLWNTCELIKKLYFKMRLVILIAIGGFFAPTEAGTEVELKGTVKCKREPTGVKVKFMSGSTDIGADTSNCMELIR